MVADGKNRFSARDGSAHSDTIPQVKALRPLSSVCSDGLWRPVSFNGPVSRRERKRACSDRAAPWRDTGLAFGCDTGLGEARGLGDIQE